MNNELREKLQELVKNCIAYGVDTADIFPCDEDEEFINQQLDQILSLFEEEKKKWIEEIEKKVKDYRIELSSDEGEHMELDMIYKEDMLEILSKE